MLRVVSMFLCFMPLNHTYLQASRYLKNYSSEDIAKTLLHAIEQHIERTPDEILNYKRTLYFASQLSKAKVWPTKYFSVRLTMLTSLVSWIFWPSWYTAKSLQISSCNSGTKPDPLWIIRRVNIYLFSELFFNMATLTHQYHFVYEIVFNWLAQQSSLEHPTILQLGVKYLTAPNKESDEATEALFWTLCIIVYRNKLEDLKKEVTLKKHFEANEPGSNI